MAEPVGLEQEKQKRKEPKAPKLPSKIKVLENARISGESAVVHFHAGQVIDDPHVIAFLVNAGAKIESC